MATASRIADIVAKTRTGASSSRGNYLAQLVAERLTGSTAESFSNAAMKWGTETEPKARLMYELLTNATVDEIDFITHPGIPMSVLAPTGWSARMAWSRSSAPTPPPTSRRC